MVTQGPSLRYTLNRGIRQSDSLTLPFRWPRDRQLSGRGGGPQGAGQGLGPGPRRRGAGAAGVLKQQQLIVLRVEHLGRDGRDPATLGAQQPRARRGPPPC